MSQSVWYLNVQQGPNAGNAYPLRGGTITIGRGSDNQIVLDDPQVSRNHARLTWQGNSYVLEDLGSVNGTWVNGARITSPVLLRPGDEVIYVTFATHVESDDWVRAMVFEELGYQVMVCFNAAARVVSCQ